MFIIGIDLSGPTNVKDTTMAVFRHEERRLSFKECTKRAGDEDIYKKVNELEKTSV